VRSRCKGWPRTLAWSRRRRQPPHSPLPPARPTCCRGGRVERTIPIQFSLGEGLDVGTDVGSPIDFTYALPFSYTGTIEKVTIVLADMDLGKAKAG